MYRLQIQDVSKSYGGIQALDNVSLQIPNGLFGLLGPNGAGKSTLMRTLATLQSPDSGTITFSGKDIFRHSAELRSQLGYLPQDFGVYPRISATDLLNHLALLKGMLNKGERRDQVAALLQQTNLYTSRKQSVSTFSGGMRQRFGIAQALLGNPQLIITDEPTSGLDPQERNRFLDLLSEIGEQVVVVLSTHIVADVHDLCPEMAVLVSGKVVLQGKPATLAEALKEKVWSKAVSREALPEYESNLKVISRRLLSGTLQLYVLSDTCPGAGFHPFEPGLEEVYFSALSGQLQAEKEGSLC